MATCQPFYLETYVVGFVDPNYQIEENLGRQKVDNVQRHCQFDACQYLSFDWTLVVEATTD